jgi:hypothetical protein
MNISLRRRRESRLNIPLRRPVLSLAALAALALSACTLQVNASVSPEGSGELVVEIGPETDELAQLAALNLTLEEACSPATSTGLDLPPDTVYRLEPRGDERWCVLVIPFPDLETLQGVLSPSISALGVNTLSLAEDRFIFDISLDLTRPVEFKGLELPPTVIFWNLVLPGQLAGHNADQVDANTLSWEIKPGVFRTLRAESTLGGGLPEGGLSGLITRAVGFACLCGLGLGAAVGGLWYLVRRRKKQASQPEN